MTNPTRTCADCGADISDRNHQATLCVSCAKRRRRAYRRPSRRKFLDCVDCGTDISDRGPLAQRCQPCVRSREDSRRVYRRTCPRCGNEFTGRSNNQKYCSDPCSTAANEEHYERMRKPLIDHELICRGCGTGFTSRNPHRRFCSPRCLGIGGHPGNVERICMVCGAAFVISRQFDKTTCSRPCKRWDDSHPGQAPIRSCQRCRRPLDGKHLNACFCSTACSVAVNYQNQGRTRAFRIRPPGCLVCGASLAGRTHNAKYCSRGCQALRNHQYRSAKLRDAPVETVSHGAVFSRDAWTCHLCCKPIDRTLRGQDPMMVSLDHIIPVSDPGYPGHVWENLAAAHLRCNIVKGPKATAHDWNLYRELVSRRAQEGGD